MTLVLAALWTAAAIVLLLIVMGAALRTAARYLIERDCDD